MLPTPSGRLPDCWTAQWMSQPPVHGQATGRRAGSGVHHCEARSGQDQFHRQYRRGTRNRYHCGQAPETCTDGVRWQSDDDCLERCQSSEGSEWMCARCFLTCKSEHRIDLHLLIQRHANCMQTGQVCMGTERIAVHASIAAEFQEALKEAIDTIYSKQPGSLISADSADRVRKLAQDAITNGARLVHGSVERHAADTRSIMHPLVVRDVAPSMDLHYTESFGPVVSLYTFETEDEALKIANDTQYGLAGAIYTENLATGLRLAKAYTTGAVHINSMTIHDETALPHGGVKSSGFGRFNGDAGLNEFLRTKVITWED